MQLRNKGRVARKARHVSWASERVWLWLSGQRWLCRGCGAQFRDRFPGLLKAQRATEAFQQKVFRDHWDGINRSRVARREHIGGATVERYCKHFLERFAASAPVRHVRKCWASTSISSAANTAMRPRFAI
jgi:transposase